jgi:hypothetical protein
MVLTRIMVLIDIDRNTQNYYTKKITLVEVDDVLEMRNERKEMPTF